MEPRGVGMGWLCMAVLCSGAGPRSTTTEHPMVMAPQAVAQHQWDAADNVALHSFQQAFASTHHGNAIGSILFLSALILKDDDYIKEDTDHGNDGLELLTDPNTTTGDTDELTTRPTASPAAPWSKDPITTTVPPQRDAAGNGTRNASALPIKYWSPAIFVGVALLVLLFTYHWTKGEGTRDRATSVNDSSDLGALDASSTPKPAAPQEERKEAEKPRALECTETTFSEQDPQPGTPPATSGPHCSGQPGAD